MTSSRAEMRAREQRWAVPVGLASIAAVVLLIASRPLNVSGDGEAETPPRSQRPRRLRAPLRPAAGARLHAAGAAARLPLPRGAGPQPPGPPAADWPRRRGTTLPRSLCRLLDRHHPRSRRQLRRRRRQARTDRLRSARGMRRRAQGRRRRLPRKRIRPGAGGPRRCVPAKTASWKTTPPRGRPRSLAGARSPPVSASRAPSASSSPSSTPVSGRCAPGCCRASGVRWGWWPAIAFLLGPLFLVALVWFVYFGLLASGSSPAAGRRPGTRPRRFPGRRRGTKPPPNWSRRTAGEEPEIDSGEGEEPRRAAERKRKQRE